MTKIVETLQKQLETKGTEINTYRETHNLKIKGEENKEPEKQDKDSAKAGGVLVAKDTWLFWLSDVMRFSRLV